MSDTLSVSAIFSRVLSDTVHFEPFGYCITWLPRNSRNQVKIQDGRKDVSVIHWVYQPFLVEFSLIQSMLGAFNALLYDFRTLSLSSFDYLGRKFKMAEGSWEWYSQCISDNWSWLTWYNHNLSSAVCFGIWLLTAGITDIAAKSSRTFWDCFTK